MSSNGQRFDRLRSATDADRDRERTYPDTDDAAEPDAIVDPHTTADTSHAGWWERITATRGGTALAGLVLILGTLAVGIVAFWLSALVVPILVNPWVQAAGGALVVFGAGVVMGGQRKQAQLNQDVLALKHTGSGRAIRYRGEYESTRSGYVFTPYKGLRGRLRKQWAPYTYAELTDTPSAPDAPATILLPQPEFAVTPTDAGLVGVMKTERIEPHPHGRDANLRARLPADANDDTVRTARRELDKLAGDIDDLEDELETERRRRQDAKQRAERPHDQALEELKDTIDALVPLLRRQSGGETVDVGATENGVDPLDRQAEALGDE